MSLLDTLKPVEAINISSPHINPKLCDNFVIDNSTPSPTVLHLTSRPLEADSDEEVIFPNLPPLLSGHPELHLRNGIMNASRLAAENVPDAEKAFFVADLSQVYLQHQRWRSCLPEIRPFYGMSGPFDTVFQNTLPIFDGVAIAVKCNPDPYVIRLLAALGAGFDCASNNEIALVLDVGIINPSDIIYANPCKAVSFIRNAAKVGVQTMTFDNSDELYKIARVHPRARCVVRILTDDSKSLCAFGVKYGAPLSTVPGLLAKAKELHLDVVGVSFHVGSGCYDPTVYTDAIERARSVFEMGRDAGYTFSLLDIGGGFEDALFEKAASVIRVAFDNYFPDRHGLQIIAEPGRFYVSTAFRLATNIIARRAPLKNSILDLPAEPPSDDLVADENQPAVMYYINDGVYGAFNCILFDHQVVHPHVLSMNGSFHLSRDEPMHLCSVWGPTCDSIDCVSKKSILPSSLRVGDWLGFDNMGAYTVCAASQFNGFEVSNVIYTAGGPTRFEVRNVLAAFAAKCAAVR